MISFRDHQPQRRPNRAVCVHYTSYRVTLRADFNRRCGYCNDYDRMRIRSFTIDHFLPQEPEGFTHSVAANHYYNLVYACMHCNLAKSNKWPTNDPNLPNDGAIGFIDPELIEYANLFGRNELGEIVSRNNNNLGKHIINELNLWLPIHAKTWQFEQLKNYEKRLKALPDEQKDQDIKDKLFELTSAISDLIDELFDENE